MAAARRAPSKATFEEAARARRQLLEAVEAGELDASTPRDVALLRRLQGSLAGWDEALGSASRTDDHPA